MNRSNGFLIVNALFVSMILVAFFYSTKTAPSSEQAGAEHLVGQKKFLKEIILLDSLFKNYKIAATANDEAGLVDSELRLKDAFKELEGTCNRASLGNEIACKLFRNYELRIQLIVVSMQARNQRSDQTQILARKTDELEKSNEQMRLQNQMVEQAILNLP